MFVFFMPARSKQGRQAKELVDGFSAYLQTVEKDRISSLDSPSTVSYVNGSAVFFEKLLPYAVALGLEKEWTKKFDGSYDKANLHITEDIVDITQSVTAMVHSYPPTAS